MAATLLVLAAGMGSRYGGLKQLDPVGPSGEVLLDYSVHDALWAGFDRVVFVIRKDFAATFRENIVRRYESRINVELCIQDPGDLPGGRLPAVARTKPLGTAHAIWSARDVVDDPFLVVNADDYYGPDAFMRMRAFLGRADIGLRMGLVAYRLENTLSEHGKVARGICDVRQDVLASVDEHTQIARDSDGSIRGVSSSGEERILDRNTPVSMNFWGFPPEIFAPLGGLLADFLDRGGSTDPSSEFYIPNAVSSLVGQGKASAAVIPTTGRWFGVTYREDREHVVNAIAEMTRQGLYNSPFWKDAK